MSLTDKRTSGSLLFGVSFGLVFGLLIGGALTLTEDVMHWWERSFLFALTFVVVIPAIYVRWWRVPSFMIRFLCTLIAFMTMNMVVHVALCVALGTPIGGYFSWPLVMMCALGTMLSAAVAQLTGTRLTTSRAP